MNLSLLNDIQDIRAIDHDDMLARILNETDGAVLLVNDGSRKNHLCNAYDVNPSVIFTSAVSVLNLQNTSLILYDRSLFSTNMPI